MVIKVYVSGISGNKEVKKRQQRVLLILDSKNVNYEVIDIAEPGSEEAKDFMQTTATSLGSTISDPTPRHPLPPQIFNDDLYCGDYDQFDMANEIDEMEKFLKLQVAEATENLISNAELKLKNGEVTPDDKESSKEEEKETAAENEVKESEASLEEESGVSEKKTNEEEVKETEESKEDEETKENVKADEDTDDEDSKAAVESEEPKDEERGEAAGEQADTEQDEAATKVEEEVTVTKNEEKADA